MKIVEWLLKAMKLFKFEVYAHWGNSNQIAVDEFDLFLFCKVLWHISHIVNE